MAATVIRGDARDLPLPDASVDLILCSPPYFGLRSYTDNGVHYENQIGSENSPQEWVANLIDCTREWVRCLKPSGSIFVNLGDKYAGSGGNGNSGLAHSYAGDTEHIRPSRGKRWDSQPKSLLGLPWRYALAACDQLGLILRAEIIWAKPNGLPESVTDRVRRAHEQIFHFVLRPRYYSAVDEIREPQIRAHLQNHYTQEAPRNQRRLVGGPGLHDYVNPLGKLPSSVWTIPSQPLTVPPHLGVDHFAAFPMELPRRVILGWSPPGVCTGCGEGRRPVSERSFRALRPLQHNTGAARHDAARSNLREANGFNAETWTPGTYAATITGYACACPQPTAPTRPALVVDPFGGTGTTAIVAAALGRHAVTVDRSADYCRLAAWRLGDPGERARALEVPKPPPAADGQASLFDLDLEERLGG
jgi:DNA modification methylase